MINLHNGMTMPKSRISFNQFPDKAGKVGQSFRSFVSCLLMGTHISYKNVLKNCDTLAYVVKCIF